MFFSLVIFFTLLNDIIWLRYSLEPASLTTNYKLFSIEKSSGFARFVDFDTSSARFTAQIANEIGKKKKKNK